MEPSTLNTIIIPSCFTLFGSILGFLSAYFAAVKSDRRHRCEDASDNFISIFENIMALIIQNPDMGHIDIIDQILKVNYANQAVAKKRLVGYLSKRKGRSLTDRWKQYEDPENIGEPFLCYYAGPNDPDKKAYDRNRIVQSIKHLISYVENCFT